jgi:hypothetical protein
MIVLVATLVYITFEVESEDGKEIPPLMDNLDLRIDGPLPAGVKVLKMTREDWEVKDMH